MRRAKRLVYKIKVNKQNKDFTQNDALNFKPTMVEIIRYLEANYCNPKHCIEHVKPGI